MIYNRFCKQTKIYSRAFTSLVRKPEALFCWPTNLYRGRAIKTEGNGKGSAARISSGVSVCLGSEPQRLIPLCSAAWKGNYLSFALAKQCGSDVIGYAIGCRNEHRVKLMHVARRNGPRPMAD